MTLTYWVSRCLDDHPCYSIREKTKKEALAKRALYVTGDDTARFGPVEKITIEYDNGFDLLRQALSEGGVE